MPYVTRTCGFTVQLCDTVKNDHNRRMFGIDRAFAFDLHARGSEVIAASKALAGSIAARGMGGQIADFGAVVEMQFARAAVIVKPIRYVGMLLNFTQSEAAANGMDGSGRNK